MLKRTAGALAAALGATAWLTAEPAAAAEPHRLSRSDTYTTGGVSGGVTCTISGFSNLDEDGSAFVGARNFGSDICTDEFVVYMTVSYMDIDRDAVQFTSFGTGDAGAALRDVASDLVIRYFATGGLAYGGSQEYRLPK